MPPRRSARTSAPSFPTPASSTSGGSTAPTPVRKTRRAISNGLPTPSSPTDGAAEFTTDPLDIMSAAEDAGRVATSTAGDDSASSPATVVGKRKYESYDEEDIFNLSPIGTASTVSPPFRPPVVRSKLGLDKTDSADNLTLAPPPKGRRAVKKEVKEEVGEEADLVSTEGRVLSRADPSRPKHQPFNIGKHSNVPKETMDSLALDSDDSTMSESPPPTPVRKGKGRASKAKAPAKPRGRGKKIVKVESESESEFDADGDGDFAMDSDEEDRQVQAAISASMGKFKSTPRTRAAKGKGKAPAKKAKLADTAREKAARAAEKRARKAHTPSGDTTVSESPFPATASEIAAEGAPSGTVTPFNELGMSSDDLSSDDFELSEGDLSEDFLSDGSETVEIKPKFKAKKSWGKGRRLNTGETAATPEYTQDDLDNMDPEEAMNIIAKMHEERRAKRRNDEEAMKPIRKAEHALKKQLGRKLTQGEKNLIRLQHFHAELHDVWGDLSRDIEPIKPVAMEAHPSLKLTLLPFQKESLYWMKKQEEGPWKGGMLADEMGMGKTIQTIALLLSEPRRKPSLVVAPVVALMQWKNEIETHAEGFKVCLWHGQSRVKAAELKKYDVVLSSYGTIEAAFRRQMIGFKRGNVYIKEASPMHSFEWFRVVLDEAHNIKERSTNVAKAAFALRAQYRWCLSGTPLQNRVGELYSLVRFLGADPFSHYFCKKCDCKNLHWQFKDRRHCDQCGHGPMEHVCFWNTEILTPIAKYGIEPGNPGHTAFKKLKILLDRMMLRRTKLERADDLGLPPRIITVRRDYFSPAEKELYLSLFMGAKRTFSTYVDQGTVLNNYSNIFSLITRMRQMACHPDLVLKSKTGSLSQKVDDVGGVCRICNDEVEDAIMSQCKHVFDRECIRQYLEVQQNRGHRPECPVCHIEISIDLEAEALDLEEVGKTGKARQGILARLDLDKWRSSSKLEALVEELEKLREKDCTIKSLVFSQFVSFLDLIAFRLQRAGFNICRLEGGMTPQQRDATIQHFMKNTEVTVFLISLKAGGVALNLTEASMVFMMDSWWNPSVEYQAMDRIHRLGQKRPVKVVKLVVQDSIEHKIVELQHKKLAMTEAALSTDPDAALGKLTVEDLGFLFKM